MPARKRHHARDAQGAEKPQPRIKARAKRRRGGGEGERAAAELAERLQHAAAALAETAALRAHQTAVKLGAGPAVLRWVPLKRAADRARPAGRWSGGAPEGSTKAGGGPCAARWALVRRSSGGFHESVLRTVRGPLGAGPAVLRWVPRKRAADRARPAGC